MDGLEGNMGQSTRDGCCAESDVEKAEFLGSECDGVELKVCGDGRDGRTPSWVCGLPWLGSIELVIAEEEKLTGLMIVVIVGLHLKRRK
ncbi:hypothetical protein M0R45_017657 [Rubus argutus]|uniref:Uncharacterized protein n=1 Tax=Rubus argutus TaxID=59490 RepID=A0AAW1XWY0_RUBAR